MFKYFREIKEVNYYWYHHGVLTDEERDLVNSRIEQHDWEFFKFVRDIFDGDDSKYNTSHDGKHMQYFPNRVSIEYEDGGFGNRFLNQETFNLIGHAECENG